MSTVFKEQWELIKDHWPEFLATTAAFFAAEVAVFVLAASPEPVVTKIAAVVLQGLIAAFAIHAAVSMTEEATAYAQAFWMNAEAASGDVRMLDAAALNFARLVVAMIKAIVAVVGAAKLVQRALTVPKAPQTPSKGQETGKRTESNHSKKTTNPHTDESAGKSHGGAEPSAEPSKGDGAGRSKPRVNRPVRGVWEQSAPPKFRQAGFTHLEFIDVIEAEANGVRSITTYIVDPAKPEPVGFVERAYDSRTNTFEMRNAFLEDVPNKIQPATGDTLTSGGTPTQTYLTLHQMKALGVEYGGLKKVKMSTIQNLQSIIELELHSRTMPLDEAVRKTYSLTYAETPIVQSGHRIVDVKFGGTPKKTRFDVLLEWYERHNSRDKPRDPEIVKKHDEIITNHGDGKVTRDPQVRWNYDIEITLAPFSGHNP